MLNYEWRMNVFRISGKNAFYTHDGKVTLGCDF